MRMILFDLLFYNCSSKCWTSFNAKMSLMSECSASFVALINRNFLSLTNQLLEPNYELAQHRLLRQKRLGLV